MFIVMGANGHLGSTVARTLLAEGHPVTAVTHDADDAAATRWRQAGAAVARGDVADPESLRAVFRRGRRAFLLNPPAAPSQDTDAVERHGVAGLLAALDGSGLEKVVAASTMGAQPGDRLGDLSVLWELEQGLHRQAIPAAIDRGAYYFSNWDAQLKPVRETGTLATMFPADFVLPMVAPHDLGVVAARRLVSGLDDVETRDVEGPARHDARDVARAFARALGRDVRVAATPRAQWHAAWRALGFSEPAAEAWTRMTAATVDAPATAPDASLRGPTTLDDYIAALVARG